MTLDPAVRAYLDEGKLSQSFLARMDVCPRSAYLYAKYRGTRAQSHAMARGEVFHAFAEQAVKQMRADGEVSMPPDVGRELMEEVLSARADLTVPHHERDALRAMAWNWSAATEAQPLNFDHLAGVELMPELRMGRWIVRGRIDRVEVVGHDAYLRDYKTSLNLPSQERFDKSFQLKFYALTWGEGTIDGERVGEGIENFHIAEEYPRFLSKACLACDKFADGADPACKECGEREFTPPTLFKRRGLLGQREVADFTRAVEGLLDKLERALRDGEWPASPGSHCSTCAAPDDCPLPRQLRPAVVTSEGEAIALAQDVDRMEAEVKKHKAALKDYASENGEIRYGDKELGFLTVRSNKTDKKALEAAMQGAEIDPRSFQKQTTSTRFTTRTVSE